MTFFDIINSIFAFAESNPVGQTIIKYVNPVYVWFDSVWATLNIALDSKLVFFFAFNLLALIIIFSILKLLFGRKKKKITFMVDGKVYAKRKVKFKKKIKFPKNPSKEGYEFIGWFTDIAGVNQYTSTKMTSKKKLTLYACFNEIVDLSNEPTQEVVEDEVVEVANDEQVPDLDTFNGEVVANEEAQTEVLDEEVGVVSLNEDSNVAQASICEEQIENIVEMTIGELYDELRVEMLSYSRAKAFNEFGLYRKHIIAEMFEKDGVINLYLAVDPFLMMEKGFKVEKFTEQQFSIVPCKKLVKNMQDYAEAVTLIKETMTLNNLIKSDLITVARTQSDEKARKAGFAFFIKNEQVASTAIDYYKLLRQNVLCYSASPTNDVAKNCDNKMILKIFKKDEDIFVYLALNAEQEGLEFVGYDKNFVDTPAMKKVNTYEDVAQAFYLIDKLMYRYGMEKFPENAETISSEQVAKNCGFGYRIRL